jgi:hypothetical protein
MLQELAIPLAGYTDDILSSITGDIPKESY